jgi:hypothetical protein
VRRALEGTNIKGGGSLPRSQWKIGKRKPEKTRVQLTIQKISKRNLKTVNCAVPCKSTNITLY